MSSQTYETLKIISRTQMQKSISATPIVTLMHTYYGLIILSVGSFEAYTHLELHPKHRNQSVVNLQFSHSLADYPSLLIQPQPLCHL